MKDFMLDENNDVVIQNGKIQMVKDNEVLKQKVRTVLNTNKGEWFDNLNEGVKFSKILGKGNTEDMIRDEIQQGLKQVDDTFTINSFEMELDKITRNLKVKFTASNSTGEEITEENIY